MKHPMITIYELIKYIYNSWDTLLITLGIGSITLCVGIYLIQFVSKNVIPI
jgi:hypothetical protein